jgi:hypothetical protein
MILKMPERVKTPEEIAEETTRETLRLLAEAPVPVGMETRLLAKLREQPQPRRVLRWPLRVQLAESAGMRAAAAALLVALLAGGGWGIAALTRPAQQAGASRESVRPALGGEGFSTAGAMRTPQTLKGPAVPMTVAAPPVTTTLAAVPEAAPTKKAAKKAVASAKSNAQGKTVDKKVDETER